MSATVGPRVRVVGNSGAGKTRLARAIAERLDVPLLEVDEIVHLEGWRTATQDEFDAGLEGFLVSQAAARGWVVDGNYATRLAAVTDTADTVVWLDYPRWLVMGRLIRRTLGRLLRRTRLWNGNRERWRTLASRDPMRNILRWTWTQHDTYRRRYTDLSSAAEAGADAPSTTDAPPQRWVRLRDPRQAEAWLRTLPARP